MRKQGCGHQAGLKSVIPQPLAIRQLLCEDECDAFVQRFFASDGARARGLRLEGCCCCFTCLREVHGACLVLSLVSRGDDEQQQHEDAKEQPAVAVTGDARADRDSDGSDSDDDSDSDSDDGDSGDAGGSEQSGGSADGCGHRQRAPPPFPRELHGFPRQEAWAALVESGRCRSEPLDVERFQRLPPKRDEAAVRFVCVSDTHCKHRGLGELPCGDVLVHTGDFTQSGRLREIEDFCTWLAAQHVTTVALLATVCSALSGGAAEPRGSLPGPASGL